MRPLGVLAIAVAVGVGCAQPGDAPPGDEELLPLPDAGAPPEDDRPADDPTPDEDDLDPDPIRCAPGFDLTTGGDCVLDTDARFDLAVLGATFTVTQPDGGEWDYGNGLPDGYVRIVFGYDEVDVRTPVVEQKLSPTWGPTLIWAATPAQLRALFRLRLMDDDPWDPTGDDPMGDCYLNLPDWAFDGEAFSAQEVHPSCPAVQMRLSLAF